MVSNILYKYCITAQNVSYLHENISIHSFIHKHNTGHFFSNFDVSVSTSLAYTGVLV